MILARLAVRLLAIACLALVLVGIFGDGVTIRFGAHQLTYRHLDVPLHLLAALALLWVLANRGRLTGVLADLAGPPEAPRGAVEHRLIAALVLIGFLLRIARVHEYGLSLDEAQFVWAASANGLWDVCRYVFAESPHPLGHFVLLHALLHVARDLLWIRLPSILAGTFLVWVSHRFAREAFGPAAGIAMALLVTFSPALVDLSRVCRNYAVGLALLVTALWFLVRHLRDGRWRDLAWFAVFEVAATLWAYAFVIVFAAATLTLAVSLVVRRAPARAWLGAALVQLPFGILVGILQVHHIARLPQTIVTFHQMIFSDRLGMPWHAPWRPILDVWEYLVPATLAPGLFALGVLALLGLLVERRWVLSVLHVSPVVLGYLAMAAGRLPLGYSRHSVHLFPSLFGLVASQVPTLLRGFGVARVRLAGAALVVVAATAYVDLAVLDYDRDVEFAPFARNHRELATYYRQRDVERAFAILAERASPEDVVMVTVQGMYAVRVGLALSPVLDPTPDEQQARDLRWVFATPGPLRWTPARGATFYMSPEGGFMFTPESLALGVRAIREWHDLPQPRRVWALRTGWELPLMPQFQQRFPSIPVDAGVDRETNGLLFVVDGAALGRLGG